MFAKANAGHIVTEYNFAGCRMKFENIELKPDSNEVEIHYCTIHQYEGWGRIESKHTINETEWTLKFNYITTNVGFPPGLRMPENLRINTKKEHIPAIINRLNMEPDEGYRGKFDVDVTIDIGDEYWSMETIKQIIGYFDNSLDDRFLRDDSYIIRITVCLNSNAKDIEEEIFQLDQVKQVVKDFVHISIKNHVNDDDDYNEPESYVIKGHFDHLADADMQDASEIVNIHPGTSFPSAVAMRILF